MGDAGTVDLRGAGGAAVAAARHRAARGDRTRPCAPARVDRNPARTAATPTATASTTTPPRSRCMDAWWRPLVEAIYEPVLGKHLFDVIAADQPRRLPAQGRPGHLLLRLVRLRAEGPALAAEAPGARAPTAGATAAAGSSAAAARRSWRTLRRGGGQGRRPRRRRASLRPALNPSPQTVRPAAVPRGGRDHGRAGPVAGPRQLPDRRAAVATSRWSSAAPGGSRRARPGRLRC